MNTNGAVEQKGYHNDMSEYPFLKLKLFAFECRTFCCSYAGIKAVPTEFIQKKNPEYFYGI